MLRPRTFTLFTGEATVKLKGVLHLEGVFKRKICNVYKKSRIYKVDVTLSENFMHTFKNRIRKFRSRSKYSGT